MGVITHPLDDGVRGFYARWGFQDLPFDPRRAMVARSSTYNEFSEARSSRAGSVACARR
jgi:hypothetical protein